MKDLYSELGIDHKASNEEIAAALKLNPGLSDYETILLDKSRRAIYDSAYSTLKTIGRLKSRLKPGS